MHSPVFRVHARHLCPAAHPSLPFYKLHLDLADTTLTTSAQLSLWLKAAADCQLEELRLRLLARLAGRLAKKERLPNIMALLTDLQGLDSRTLSQLVAILAAAGEPPTSDSLASAVDKAAGIGSAEWMLTQFSQQPRGPNQCVYSPWFDLQGKHAMHAVAGVNSWVLQACEPGLWVPWIKDNCRLGRA